MYPTNVENLNFKCFDFLPIKITKSVFFFLDLNHYTQVHAFLIFLQPKIHIIFS
jgi:hypothetical protein